MATKSNNEPLVPRGKGERKLKEVKTKTTIFKLGWLKNGNPPGNPNTAPRCGAKAKRTGEPCRQPAMSNARCRLHGGLSTGPKTFEGQERARRGNWKHGEYSQESKEELKALRQGMTLLMNADAIFSMTPEEMQTHEATLDRLMDKLQRGIIQPYRQARQ